MNQAIPARAKLWNRDFTLLATGQIVSIFGNMVLSFALPLYILDISESAALFGLVLGMPYISLLLMSPIGGIMADRLKKQRVMFWLDLTTTVIIVLYMIASGLVASAVPIVLAKLMALNAIQGAYMPAVQASIPALAPPDKLVSANSIVTTINMTANLLAPAVAGALYGGFGLFPILVISAICFAITAVMDLLIRIPFKKQSSAGSVAQMVKSDISASLKFIVKEKPILGKAAGIMFWPNLVIVSLLFVGLPVIVVQHLGFSMALVGVNQSGVGIGGLLGGIAAGALGERLTTRRIYLTLAIGALLLVPMALAVMLDIPAFAAFIAITASGALSMALMQVSSIPLIAFIQKETPSELIGKVMSMMLMLPFLASALGMLIFGVLFEQFSGMSWVLVFGVVLALLVIAAFTRRLFKAPGKSAGAENPAPSEG